MSVEATASLRAGEVTVAAPLHGDAALYFIGSVRTPWSQSRDCPRQGDREHGPICRIEVNEPWRAALKGLEGHSHAQILYWMHLARRDLVLQSPRSNGETTGSFAIRSPNRPNPVSSSLVADSRRARQNSEIPTLSPARGGGFRRTEKASPGHKAIESGTQN